MTVQENPGTRPSCTDIVPEQDWAVYHDAIRAFESARIAFAVGGGMAYGCYVSRPRYTKDLDLFVLPHDRERVIAAMTACGFTDYFEVQEYQRHWIYRGHRDGLILDCIWQMANERAMVDESWLARGPVTLIHDTPVRLVPAEEILWGKLYVLQRERSDWPDVLNLLASTGATLDWPRLVHRLGVDLPLLSAVVQLFAWVAPRDARRLPPDAWELLQLAPPTPDVTDDSRAALLDSREWLQSGEGS